MRHPAKSLTLPAAILAAAFLLVGCGSAASSIISNLPSRTATAPVTSAAPVTSEAVPETTAAAPVTSAVTITATAPAPAASAAASATGSTGSGTDLLWLWILLAAAALAGLIFWIAHASRRRSADAASSRSRLIDAYAKGSALHDAMSVAEAPGGLFAGDAGARWADIQRRADDLTQTLYALRESEPDPAGQARIADVLASLQAVRSAMDAERAPGGASPQQTEVVRGRLYSFEMSLRALRGSDQP